MKIISYNVNGIRAAINKGFVQWLQAAEPDVICLQEIKATKEQVPLLDIELAGYPYHFWYSAEKKGYSGVAILSKKEPDNVVFGTGIPHMDFEGAKHPRRFWRRLDHEFLHAERNERHPHPA